jgi:galactose mutarotase-like enzyme
VTLLVTGGGLELAIEPDDGGRITSLCDSYGHEWLLQPTAAWPGGWDEVAPSIRPVTLPDGTRVPDHGDALSTPWRVERASAIEVELSVRLRSVPVRLRRRASATTGGIRLDYEASTASIVPVPFLWAAHPQFSGSGVRLELPPELLVIEEHPRPGRRQTLPSEPFDELASGSSLKVFTATTVEQVELVRGAHRLAMSWSASALPWLGLFWDAGEFAGERVIAIEPSTGFGDSLLDATATRRVLTVVRDAPLLWSLDLRAG